MVRLYVVHRFLHFVVREYAEVDIGDAQVGRDTHLAHGDECALQGAGIAQENVAQILLDKAGYFVLTSRLHFFVVYVVFVVYVDFIAKQGKGDASLFPVIMY